MQMQSSDSFFLGVDGGGTKTKFTLSRVSALTAGAKADAAEG